MKKLNYAIAALSALLLVACSEKKEKQRVVLDVTVESVSLQADALSSSYVGQIEEQSATTLSFPGSGTIKQMLVSEGQHVSKGQLVAVIDEAQSKNALATAEASLMQAQDGYDRLKQVHDAGSLAEQKWVEIQSQLQQAKATRDMARQALKDCRLVSPVSGVVGDVTLEAGETALPSVPVCTVLNIDQVKVKVAVPEHEIAAITASSPSRITVAAVGDATFNGGKIEKGVTADALTRTYDIKILLPNPGHKLLPGMVASVSLGDSKAAAGEDKMTLPVTAVQQNNGGPHFVWLVKDGKATRTEVTIGSLTGNRVVINGGLSLGDKVIVEGYQKVSEGQEVRF